MNETNVIPLPAGDPIRAEIKRRQKRPEELRLPPLLEERRVKYAIPNGAFNVQAVFDRILVWQIPDFEGETFGDTKIIMPDRARTARVQSTPRGVLVSAGQLALDNMRANGVEIGHIVTFVRLAPWRLPVDVIDGNEQHLLVLRSGDLIGSEDLRADVFERPAAIVLNVETMQHLYIDKQNQMWVPSTAAHPDDY